MLDCCLKKKKGETKVASKKKKVCTPFDPTITIPGIYPKEIIKNILFIIVKEALTKSMYNRFL